MNNEMNTNIAQLKSEIMNPANWSDEDRQFIDTVKNLSPDKLDLLLTITELIIENPAREKLALSWKGKMKDLPAALAQI